MLTDDDLEPRKRAGRPRVLDAMSVDELNGYVTDLKAEITRVEAAIEAKRAHMAAMSALFKTPD